jgi:hypothetical protein
MGYLLRHDRPVPRRQSGGAPLEKRTHGAPPDVSVGSLLRRRRRRQSLRLELVGDVTEADFPKVPLRPRCKKRATIGIGLVPPAGKAQSTLMPVSMLLNAWFPRFFVSKRRTFTRKSMINLN